MTDVDRLVELLDGAGDSPLVEFQDGESWELSGFAVAQDMDEDSLHASAGILRIADMADSKRRCFRVGDALFLKLVDIVSIRDPDTGELRYQRAILD